MVLMIYLLGSSERNSQSIEKGTLADQFCIQKYSILYLIHWKPVEIGAVRITESECFWMISGDPQPCLTQL
jgi:hypothetical protein